MSSTLPGTLPGTLLLLLLGFLALRPLSSATVALMVTLRRQVHDRSDSRLLRAAAGVLLLLLRLGSAPARCPRMCSMFAIAVSRASLDQWAADRSAIAASMNETSSLADQIA
jgi:hypothetical protein